MSRSRLFLFVALTSVLVFGACTTSPTEDLTSEAPTASTPAAGCPWKVVYAADDPSSFMLPGNLVVGLDFGRAISSEEQSEFKGKVSIADGKGKEYECIASMTCSSMTITRGGETYEFGPTIFFSFDVESGVPSYSFKFEDWPPVDLGNPFSQPIYSP